MENLVVSLFSGFIGGMIVAFLTLWLKDKIDLRKAIRYLHAEVKENLSIYDLNQELLKGTGGTYRGEKVIVSPFHNTAWETLKAKGYFLNLAKNLQKDLQNLYLEIGYENELILSPLYLTSVAQAVDLRERMIDMLPQLLKDIEQDLRKKLDA